MLLTARYKPTSRCRKTVLRSPLRVNKPRGVGSWLLLITIARVSCMCLGAGNLRGSGGGPSAPAPIVVPTLGLGSGADPHRRPDAGVTGQGHFASVGHDCGVGVRVRPGQAGARCRSGM